MKICDICGNEIEDFVKSCPFCGFNSKKTKRSQPSSKYITKNIKFDLPTCEEAIKKLNFLLHKAHYENIKVIKLIHGYGSSGKGGELRYCIREYLEKIKWQGKIKFYVTGEDFSRNSVSGRKLLNTFPYLVNDKDLNRTNCGITFIVV